MRVLLDITLPQVYTIAVPIFIMLIGYGHEEQRALFTSHTKQQQQGQLRKHFDLFHHKGQNMLLYYRFYFKCKLYQQSLY